MKDEKRILQAAQTMFFLTSTVFLYQSVLHMLSLVLFHDLPEEENACLEKQSDDTVMKKDTATLSPQMGALVTHLLRGKEQNIMARHEFPRKCQKSSPLSPLHQCGDQHLHDTYDALKFLILQLKVGYLRALCCGNTTPIYRNF